MDILVFWLVIAIVTLIFIIPKVSSRRRILLFIFLPLVPLVFAWSQLRTASQIDKSRTIKTTSTTIVIGSGTGIGIGNLFSMLFPISSPEPELPPQVSSLPIDSPSPQTPVIDTSSTETPASTPDEVSNIQLTPNIAEVSAQYPDNAANLRRTPDGEIITAIRNGAAVTILYYPVNSKWVRVKYGENEGWVYGQLLRKPLS